MKDVAGLNKKDEYIRLISLRGDHYGYNKGLYDLLTWSGRMNLSEVTEEEARLFFENPDSEYPYPKDEDQF